MRRNRVIAGTSAFLVGVTGILAASLGTGGGNTADGVPQPTTTLAAPSPPLSVESVSRAGEVRIAAVGDMNGPRTYARNSPSGRNGAAITRLVKNNEIDAFLSDGMTAFQVSTGGIGLRSFTNSPPYIVKRFSNTHGFLRMTLRDNGSFDWKFIPTTGKGTDAGTRSAPK